MESGLLICGTGFVGVALTTRALSRKATTFFKVMFALGLAMVMASMIIWWTSAAM